MARRIRGTGGEDHGPSGIRNLRVVPPAIAATDSPFIPQEAPAADDPPISAATRPKRGRPPKPKDAPPEETLASDVPQGTPGTLAYSFSRMDGGLEAAIVYARRAAENSEEIQKFIDAYDAEPEHLRGRIRSIDRICRDSGCSAETLLGAVAFAAQRWGVTAGKLQNASRIHEVMDASLTNATFPEGVEDRKMQFEIAGILERKKGPTVQIQNINSNSSSASSDRGLPSFEDDARETVGIVRSVDSAPTPPALPPAASEKLITPEEMRMLLPKPKVPQVIEVEQER